MCSLHFTEFDYESETKTTQGPIKRRILKSSAVPSIFPRCPKYLSRPAAVPRQTTSSTSQVRRNKEIVQAEEAAEDFLRLDNVSSLSDLREKLDPTSLPCGTNQLEEQGKIVFASIATTELGKAFVKYSLTVEEDLSFSLWSDGLEVPSKKVSHIVEQQEKKIRRCSDVANVLAFLKHYQSVPRELLDIIELCTTLLQAAAQECCSRTAVKLEFIIEQLQLAQKSNQQRKYSPALLSSAAMWHNVSPGMTITKLCINLDNIHFTILTLILIINVYRLQSLVTSFQHYTSNSWMKIYCPSHLSATCAVCQVLCRWKQDFRNHHCTTWRQGPNP